MLPNIRAIIPASVNLMPANNICVAVPDAGMLNKPYPIFIHGNALPHNKQQRNAPNHTTIVFCINFSLLSITLIYSLSK
jgi:hypothetical protein